MEYSLKDKIIITKDFLNDLEVRSWQEIENLQNQITNIEPTDYNSKVIQLLKSLLTSYYVFAGGLENLNSEEIMTMVPKQVEEPSLEIEVVIPKPEAYDIDTFEPVSLSKEIDQEVVDPFEYFVDFDDPVGEPLTDDDLYN